MTPLPIYPPIPLLAPAAYRPFVSVMIPTYNCATYLRHALKSVLKQGWSPLDMQIEVVDDGSTADDPETVVQELGGGRVSFFRQPVNVGPQRNFTTCVKRAHGEWVHVLHGDDMVVEGFYDAMRRAALSAPLIHAFFCAVINIDERNRPVDRFELGPRTAGIVADLVARLAVQNLIMFPSIVVRRSAYESLGGFHLELFHSADWDMWKRIAVHHPVWYDPAPLALYRLHEQSDTSRLMQTGANIADARHAIEIASAYLPAADARRLTSLARRHHAMYAMEVAEAMASARRWRAAWRQVVEGLRCSAALPVWAEAVNVAWAAATNVLRRPPQSSAVVP